jgi:hypothetical protein
MEFLYIEYWQIFEQDIMILLAATRLYVDY